MNNDKLTPFHTIGHDIKVALDNGAIGGALILTYAAIDAMAFLSMPESQRDVKRDDFIIFNVEGNYKGKLIAPMLLVPFIENAFKHGDKKNKGSGIIINLRITGELLNFEVVNSKSINADKDQASGIGLNNIRRRLELIYIDSFDLTIQETDRQYKINLSLKI